MRLIAANASTILFLSPVNGGVPMGDVICTEWAIARENGLEDIVAAKDNDVIVFPHVDSCCAFIFLMRDGSGLGGHASQVGPKNQFGPGESSDDILARMLEKAGGAPQTIIAICNADGWAEAFPLAQGKIPDLASCQASNYCGRLKKAADIFVDLGTGRLQCQDWVKGPRGDAVVPLKTNDWVFDKPLATIQRTISGASVPILQGPPVPKVHGPWCKFKTRIKSILGIG
jgi:hypothetical protein